MGAFRCLKVGVGPGRSMFEWMSANPSQSTEFDCIEIDPKAIEYAAALNMRFADRVSFIRTNCRRYRPEKSYQLIWAAGIFDYFDDDVFRQMLGNLLPAVASGGELVIGNFADTSASRPCMEFALDWILYHRGADRLVLLAEQCGVPRERIRIGCEQLGVNLFLHIAA
ncbi:MAG: class I SAM-dependent methyltransferase [Sulfuritalea sp.]|nr:class I SAM-dependent methyltransferase [Sulfuritalea sp.]